MASGCVGVAPAQVNGKYPVKRGTIMHTRTRELVLKNIQREIKRKIKQWKFPRCIGNACFMNKDLVNLLPKIYFAFSGVAWEMRKNTF